MKRRRIVQSLAAAAGAIVATIALTVPAQGAKNNFIQGNLQPLQTLTTNPCGTTTRDFGTNFPTPSDPNGFGFANQTAIGWEGNIYAPFEYLSGSYFARGVTATFHQRLRRDVLASASTTCGLPANTAPAPGSVQWTMADGYLPAMTTSFTRNDVAISITDFADKQTIAGSPAELVYTRVSVTNNGSRRSTSRRPASGPNLVELDSGSDTVQPGQTVNHDFVAAVDTFTVGGTLPTVAQITADASTYDAAFAHMTVLLERPAGLDPDPVAAQRRRCPTPTSCEPRHRDRQRLQGRFRLHQIVQVDGLAVLRRQQLRLAAQP